MPNYQNGKIYTIRSHQTEMIYIGSTTQSLSTRLAGHRRNFKKWKNGKYHYVTSFDILKYDDAYIELLRECKCDNRQQLCAIEGQWVRRCRVAVNKRIEGRTKAEYYQDNRPQIAAYKKQHYQDHKEEIKVQMKQYYQDNKPQISAYGKQYRRDYKQHIAAKDKQRYEANKGKFVCYECEYRCNQNSHLTQHKKTKKHLEMVAFLIECGGEDYNDVE